MYCNKISSYTKQPNKKSYISSLQTSPKKQNFFQKTEICSSAGYSPNTPPALRDWGATPANFWRDNTLPANTFYLSLLGEVGAESTFYPVEKQNTTRTGKRGNFRPTFPYKLLYINHLILNQQAVTENDCWTQCWTPSLNSPIQTS